MTTFFQHDCPHCGTKEVAFTMLGEVKIPAVPYDWHVFATCGHCGRGIVAFFFADSGSTPISSYTPSRQFVRLICAWPDPIWGQVPDHLPDNVARFFRQGLDGMVKNYDAAGAMFRKALDVGLKEKFPAITGTLFERINKAVAQGSLTKDLGDWANHIRLEGNDAAHEDDPYTEAEARDLHVFADLVMRYLFTLPGMLDDRRKNKGKAATAK